ncbi:MAG: PorT family protein [Bacteroidales bacterium]|jgi:hypothetical protein|nr:PorT family protein [Bacteroidales bacterium]
MKKTALILVVLIGFVTSAIAQDVVISKEETKVNSKTLVHRQENKFDIGVECAPSLIFMRGNDMIKNYHKPTIGFSAGIFFQYNFPKIFSLRTNIAYERKGSVLKDMKDIQITTVDQPSEFVGRATIHTNYDYLTFPILVRATFGKKVNFFVNVGPYFGCLIKQTTVVKIKESKISQTYEETSYFKRFDIGIATGLGLSVPIKTNFAFSFEVRNNLGLYNVSKIPVANNGTIKTNSTNFLLGFTYKLGQRTSIRK